MLVGGAWLSRLPLSDRGGGLPAAKKNVIDKYLVNYSNKQRMFCNKIVMPNNNCIMAVLGQTHYLSCKEVGGLITGPQKVNNNEIIYSQNLLNRIYFQFILNLPLTDVHVSLKHVTL